MEKLRSVIFVLLLSLLFVLPIPSVAEDTESLKHGIVRVSVETLDGEKKTGAGFIVELQRDFAFIVTASAVVVGADQIAVEFFPEPDKSVPASVIVMEGEDPQGLAVLLAEGEIPPGSLALELNDRIPLHIGDTVFTMGFSDSEGAWLLRQGETTGRAGRTITLSGDIQGEEFGSPLVKEGQVIGVVTELKKNKGLATPAVIASYILESWGVGARQQKNLAKTLAAESIALLLQVDSRTPKEKRLYWPALIEQEKRADLLQRSLLLAVESMRRSPSSDGQKALRAGLALLTRPLIQMHPDPTSDKVKWHPNGVAFSPDGRFLATAHGTYGFAKIWDATTGIEVAHFLSDADVSAVAFGPDGRYLATAGEAGTTQVWEITSRKEVVSMRHDGTVTSIAFSPDGSLLLTASDHKDQGFVHVWNLADGQGERWHLPIEQRYGARVLFDPKGIYFAAKRSRQSGPGRLWVWVTATGELVWELEFKLPVYGMAFSADGNYLAATVMKEPARVWSVPEGQELVRLPGVAGTPAFSSDGRYLALTSHQDVKVWDFSQDTERQQLLPGDEVTILHHEEGVRAVDFSQDGKYIATGCADATARVWELPTGREVARTTHINKGSRLFYHGQVIHVAISPDGHSLVSRDDYGTTRLWRLFAEDLVAEACKRLDRNLTPKEWRSYLRDEPYRNTCEGQP